jgi:hypothetical protein
MPEKAVRALRKLIEEENFLLRGILEKEKISKQELELLRELQEKKRELLTKILRFKQSRLERFSEELKLLTSENRKNKALLLSLIRMYRY